MNTNKEKRSYQKVEQATRDAFIQILFSKRLSIKDAASRVGLNYWAAKNILVHYKRNGFTEPLTTRKRREKYDRLAALNAAFEKSRTDSGEEETPALRTQCEVEENKTEEKRDA